MSKYNTREIISRKLRLFALLLFMDTDNSYNKVIISQIQDEAASASFYEAFFESAPQLLFQVFKIFAAIILHLFWCTSKDGMRF